MGEARRRKLAGNVEPKTKPTPVVPQRKVVVGSAGGRSVSMMLMAMAGMMQQQDLTREIMSEMRK